MIPVTAYRDRTVVVLGAARSGLAAADALAAGGAQVLVWDDDPSRRDAARAQGHETSAPTDWHTVAALVPSPGVPLSHPMIRAAQAAPETEVVGDIELLTRAQPAARRIAVTGTNGKSTTTALIGHMLETAGCAVQTGGNLGTPALALEPADASATFVLELSSYQLDLTTSASFDVALLLNIAPDHLDRHGTMVAYVAAKRNIFRPGRLETAIVGIDDKESRSIFTQLRDREDIGCISVSVQEGQDADVTVADGILRETGVEVCDLRRAPALPGRHNWQNAAAAYSAGRAIGLRPEVLGQAIHSFPGLPHRMERAATVGGVPLINDSKATNASAAAQALACYDRIYWIAGGRPKSDGIGALASLFPRIAHAYLIGEAEAQFADTLADLVPTTRCGTLDAAVPAALAAARDDPADDVVVLFSPACASFDQFANFEDRGDAFRAAALALAGCEGGRQCTG